jgi:hypothetical protein
MFGMQYKSPEQLDFKEQDRAHVAGFPSKEHPPLCGHNCGVAAKIFEAEEDDEPKALQTSAQCAEGATPTISQVPAGVALAQVVALYCDPQEILHLLVVVDHTQCGVKRGSAIHSNIDDAAEQLSRHCKLCKSQAHAECDAQSLALVVVPTKALHFLPQTPVVALNWQCVVVLQISPQSVLHRCSQPGLTNPKSQSRFELHVV